MKNRYANLFRSLDMLLEERAGTGEPFRIMEIGVWKGEHARRMIKHCVDAGQSDVEYYGFDLFEDMTDEDHATEVSKAKRPPSREEVLSMLQDRTPAKVFLFKGNTKITLPENVGRLPPMDLIFIDGGHSLETIANDWTHAKRLMGPTSMALFDDYYFNRDDAGCKPLVEGLGPEYDVSVLEPRDHFGGSGLTINFVRVTRRGSGLGSSAARPAAWPTRVFRAALSRLKGVG